MIYAGAQKNLGPSGVTVVAIKEDFLAKAHADLPTMMSYKVFADKDSMYNTPPCFSIYILNLVLKWLKKNGGLDRDGQGQRCKAEALYAAIDGSRGYYQGPADKDARSWMNVVFSLPNPELEEKFIKEAKAAGIVQIKGYRTVGGIRFSHLQRGQPRQDVETTVGFMQDFRTKNPA